MTTQVVPSSSTAKPAGSVDFVASALAAFREEGALLVVTVPAPVAPLEALLGLDGSEDAIVWEPREGTAFAALGAVATLVGRGHGRVEEVRAEAAELFARLRRVDAVDGAPGPRCFGGLAFEPGGAAETPWSSFGDARFVFPRLRYARGDGKAFLSLAVTKDESSSEARRARLVALAESALARLRAAALGPERRHGRTSPAVTDRREVSAATYRDLVETARSEVARGALEKVVVARRTELTFEAPPDPVAVLEELAEGALHCTRFSFRFGGATFLGVSPERLVRRKGLELQTEALAGSNRPGDPARAVELFESPKERAEHAPVVREIVRTLGPLCSSLSHAPTPEVRTLRHVLHLRTPIVGHLSRPIHVLDLALRLHPTPAVGGVPAKESLRFIVEHEPVPRGWYASPVGWFDDNGDGEFFVALRSGAFVGDRAYLYAGGGIVRDSDPESEYEETRLKLAALCTALRVAQ
ncbi:MAG TPA: isochorismate synthase [Polyangiaceae bacterium]|nr:isochorismate synthase [Polyangiaceae bacterium]